MTEPPAHDLGELERLANEGKHGCKICAARALAVLPALIAVVKAAHEYEASSQAGPPYSKVRAKQIADARQKIRAALRPFYGGGK